MTSTCSTTTGPRRRVLVTGGAGTIATGFAQAHHDEFDLTLLDLPGRFEDQHAALGELVVGDLRDLELLKRAFRGIDTVVHLGGQRSPSAVWADLLDVNIVGTYNVTAAAISAGCRRVVYASSVHAVSGYDAARQVPEEDPVNPGDLYGVSKCFGEALGRYVAGQEGLSFAALRIGAFQEPASLHEPDAGWMVRDYCSPTDLFRLIHTIIEADSIGFEIFNAVSGNTLTRLPMGKARAVLGYTPEHDSFEESPAFRAAVHAVGGLADRPTLSGMREDVSAIPSDVPS